MMAKVHFIKNTQAAEILRESKDIVKEKKKVQFSENQTVMHSKNLISINLSKCCQLISEDNWP